MDLPLNEAVILDWRPDWTTVSLNDRRNACVLVEIDPVLLALIRSYRCALPLAWVRRECRSLSELQSNRMRTDSTRLRAIALAFAVSAIIPATAFAQTESPPPIQRELRAAWVASVANIDWPSKPGLSTWDQQAELIAILNRCVALNLNAVILQVRPAADALYDSPYEPWSEYLTGAEGRAPEPYYDPLAWAVAEAH
jgi:uncharacterized lipoprotein YddW (UPF0748 family)